MRARARFGCRDQTECLKQRVHVLQCVCRQIEADIRVCKIQAESSPRNRRYHRRKLRPAVLRAHVPCGALSHRPVRASLVSSPFIERSNTPAQVFGGEQVEGVDRFLRGEPLLSEEQGAIHAMPSATG